MTINHKLHNILWIDRWSKYIGVAYSSTENEVIFPLGYLLNDQMVFFSLSELIYRHRIKTIIIGRPTKQKDIQDKITQFMTNLDTIIQDQNIILHTQEEDYSSVQSGEILSSTAQSLGLGKNSYRKNSAQDTVSAMVILERRKNSPYKL